MSGKVKRFDPPSSASSESDVTDPDYIITVTDNDEKDNDSEMESDCRSLTSSAPHSSETGKRLSSNHKMNTTGSLSTKKIVAESVLTSRKKTMYIAGRPPWYNTAGQYVEPFLIGICGGSASGKSTVARKMIESLDVTWVTLLSIDSFYKVLNEEQREKCSKCEYNFDHPDAFDFDLLISTLQRLKEGKKVDVPIYNFVTHSRENRTKTMYGANVVLLEGILAFHHPVILDMLDMKIFVETDADVRLARRLRRDICQRGRDVIGVLKQYINFVKPAFMHYIAPTMRHADIIVPRGGENTVAIQLIVQHIHTQLQLRGFALRESLATLNKGQPLPESLHILPTTPQINGLHTFIRDKNTIRDEFIFYSQRLMRLVIEYALSLLPFEDVVVDTPQGVPYQGKRCAASKICGVSILRAGETMEQAFRDVSKDTRIGKILIQTNRVTGEPELYYLRLPKDIKDYMVMLMDATVATGAAAMMAIRVLLDHDVPEENILLASLLMAESGVHTVAYAFSQVRMVTSAVDPEVNEKFYVLPGIGNFGDRYFGTEPSDQ